MSLIFKGVSSIVVYRMTFYIYSKYLVTKSLRIAQLIFIPGMNINKRHYIQLFIFHGRVHFWLLVFEM
jgi:hypothetical protein